MLLTFQVKDNGICLDDCDYINGIKKGSYACELCRYYFGIENGKIRCGGERLKNEARVQR